MKKIERTRLQTYITVDFDKKLNDYAEKLGMTKNEFVKYALTTVMVSIDQTNDALKDYVKNNANNLIK